MFKRKMRKANANAVPATEEAIDLAVTETATEAVTETATEAATEAVCEEFKSVLVLDP